MKLELYNIFKPCYAPMLTVAFLLVSCMHGYMYSGWSIYNNALSDLGAPVSSTALLFNLGLCFVSLYILSTAVLYRLFRWWIVSMFAALISVVHEGYPIEHFIVSVMFFVAGLATALKYALRKGDKLVTTLTFLSLLLWTTHFALRVPPGAAIPEIVSIAAILLGFVGDASNVENRFKS